MLAKLLFVVLVVAVSVFAQSQMPWTKVKCEGERIRARTSLPHDKEDPQSRLMDSIRFCDCQTAVDLIDTGINLNFEDERGRTPLNLAIDFGENTILQHLLQHGADPDRTSKENSWATVLMGAALTGNTEAVRVLLLYGAKPNKTDIYRATALMYAAERGNAEIVKLLLAYGADARLRDKFSQSAEDSARRAKHSEIVELLKAAREKR